MNQNEKWYGDIAITCKNGFIFIMYSSVGKEFDRQIYLKSSFIFYSFMKFIIL